MKLSNVKPNAQLIINDIIFENKLEENCLNNYNLIIGEQIMLIDYNSFKDAFYIQIENNQFYINTALAKRVEVSYA